MGELRAQEDAVSEVMRSQEVDELARLSRPAVEAMEGYLTWAKAVTSLSVEQAARVRELAGDVLACLFDALSELHATVEAAALLGCVRTGVKELECAQHQLVTRKYAQNVHVAAKAVRR
jgi:hypothetical protein